ncbi:hypothetical protein [Cupriavidus metallidurans]|jgi:hypothetical protein|uniref:Uncharacterized protein n=1 Tax=Cupriavidus metallidurans TaxID=119219 RepID=A0A482IN53_9BURK|nr:hypothetical protein [Cupriavidus metallidurans]QBP09356.1 hypothetical protein DDF84_006090 [Cupriavidus metallidurans]
MSIPYPYPCLKCRGPVQVFGSRWCKDCHYPGIDETYQRYRDYIEEGYSRYQAKVMSGWGDPDEAKED